MNAKLSILRLAAALTFACSSASAQPAAPSASLAAYSPDKSHDAVVADQGRVHYRRTSDKTVEQTFYICNAQALNFSADGKFLAAGGGRNGSQGKIKVWRLADYKQLGEIITSSETAQSLALSTDGSIVAAASSDGRLEAWSVADGKLQWSRTHSSSARSIRFSADGKKLLVQGEDGVDREIDPASGRNMSQREPAKP